MQFGSASVGYNSDVDPLDADDDRKKALEWIGKIHASERAMVPWIQRGKHIVKRYRAEGAAIDTSTIPSRSKFNILWSNVETLRPALYGRVPVPDCSRRYKDADPVGNLAAQILERCLSFHLAVDDAFDNACKAAVTDRLLPGRGVLWERYVPQFSEPQMPRVPLVPRQMMAEDEEAERSADPGAAEWVHPSGSPVKPDAIKDDPVLGKYVEEGEEYREVLWEQSVTEYVFWQDITFSSGRSWSDIQKSGWVKRNNYLTRKQLIERFGEELGKKVPLNYEPEGLDEKTRLNFGERIKKGLVWEIWDASTGKVTWMCPEYIDRVLDEQDDPLQLEGFFPMAPPLCATTTTDTFTPVPDYVEYQDQARQLDDTTARLDILIQALRVIGIYDASNKATLSNLLSLNRGENMMLPVENWAMLAEKGGMRGVVDWFPLDQIVGTMTSLFEVRDRLKQDLYEITGMADIIRGQNDPDSTATAERIKGRFASFRLGDSQTEVQKFIRSQLRIKAEIIRNHFSPETILEMSGFAQMQGVDKNNAMQAIQLLKSDRLSAFRIGVETDSTIAQDETEQQASANQLLMGVTGYMKTIEGIVEVAPEMLPPLKEMLMMAVRRYKAGRSVEESVEKAFDALGQRVQQDAAQPKPSPEEIKAQTQIQVEQAKAQAQVQSKTAELQVQKANDERDYAARQAELQAQTQRDQMLAAMQAQHDRAIAEMQGSLELMKQRMADESALQIERIRSATQIRKQEMADQAQHERAESAAYEAREERAAQGIMR